MEIKKVGVVGCGTMGSGIAQVCAEAKYDVTVSDATQELVDKGIGNIRNLLTRWVDKGKIEKEHMDLVLGRIKGTTSIDDFKDCDIVIEAVVEKMEVKKQVFTSLDRVCKKDAILATNTSALSVTNMAATTKRMERVLGTHFIIPPTLLRVIEMVRTIATGDEVIEITKKFCESLDMFVFVTKDSPGFVMNSIQVPMMLQAIRMLESGLATRDEIDTMMTKGMGHRMGPLAVIDSMGLDVTLDMVTSAYEETKSPVWAPPLLLKMMVAAGWLGRKTGKGFYDYS